MPSATFSGRLDRFGAGAGEGAASTDQDEGGTAGQFACANTAPLLVPATKNRLLGFNAGFVFLP